ncbi:MAG TPA: deoxyribose-phosphate aldolase [Saprospiraceae bacterium]|nr:deoxyribose-phosphate aldolase [Saprospiraceae bacterium]
MHLAQYIDHSYLRPDGNEEIIDRMIAETIEFGFKAICLPPMYLRYAKEKAENKTFLLCTVAGFPIGYDHVEAKLASLRQSADLGADEVDVVINLSAVKTGHWDLTRNELKALHETAVERGITLKSIIEAQLLTEDEIMHMCEISNDLGLHYVKTSTGFFGDPVREEIVKLLRRNLEPSIKIKASGGINRYQQAVQMIRAGADRLGCSNSVAIVKETITE